MSVIGPRPQLVRDMTFMTKEQRMRHTAKPGLSGLAQVNGRNSITWEDKLEWDQKYIKKIGFKEDVMKKNGYTFSYTDYEEIDMASNKTGIKVTGPKKITKMGMYNYCWPGCLTVMYDANEIGLIQIEDIKKNNDYAMWLKVCKKANCYLLDEVLAQYRKGRAGSVSTHSIRTMIGWHYMLYHEAEKMGKLESLFNTGRNLLFGFYKKKKYVR